MCCHLLLQPLLYFNELSSAVALAAGKLMRCIFHRAKDCGSEQPEKRAAPKHCRKLWADAAGRPGVFGILHLPHDLSWQTKALFERLNWTAAWSLCVFLCPDILAAPRIRQMTCEQTRTVNLNINRWCNLVNEISARGLEPVRKEPCR